MGNPNQAGLPQTQSASGGLPLGALQAMPTFGLLQTLADGSKWLRTGAIIAKALAPLGQLVEYLRAYLFSESASAAPSFAVTGVVSNGVGTFVAYCQGDGTNVVTSTDGGVTWTNRAHNLGSTAGPNDMVWTGTRFVGVGCIASGTMYACTSSDGVTWAASTVFAIGGAYAVNTARVTWTGTAVVFCASANVAAGCVGTSPTGLTGTWTSRTPTVINNTPYIDSSAHGTIIQWGTNVQTSDTTGVTWTARTPGVAPVTGAQPMAFSDKFVLTTAATGSLIYSTDQGVTWSAAVSNGIGDVPNYALMGKLASGRVYGSCIATSQIAYSDDGLFWKVQGYATANPASTYPATTAAIIATDGVSTTVLCNTAAQKHQYCAGTFSSTNAVGTGVLNTTGTSGSNLYAKVK